MHVATAGDLGELEDLDLVEVEVELDVKLDGAVAKDPLSQGEFLPGELED